MTGDEPQGTMGRVLPAFLCARERDVWVRVRFLTVVFGFLFVSDYIIKLSTRLLTWNTCMNLKSIYWAYPLSFYFLKLLLTPELIIWKVNSLPLYSGASNPSLHFCTEFYSATSLTSDWKSFKLSLNSIPRMKALISNEPRLKLVTRPWN